MGEGADEDPEAYCRRRERFAALVPDAPRVEIKPMFGNLGAFVNGNMFMGALYPMRRGLAGRAGLPRPPRLL